MGIDLDHLLKTLRGKYDARASSVDISELYASDDHLGHMFSVLHRDLNQHFDDINDRADSTHHYWAENSRGLIKLIAELEEDLESLNRAGMSVVLDERYQKAVERCRPWLRKSGGSEIPEDFAPIPMIRYEPVFIRPSDSVTLPTPAAQAKLTMLGEGSYARVYSFVDPHYGITFALKRAKSDISSRDMVRFRKEFEVLNALSFPYVVEVYRYDQDRSEYLMEFCDTTLRDYISKRNQKLTFSTRRRIALQFLYGVNYLHSQGVLHRDISLQNVLVKTFDGGAVTVKLSDFGLVKEEASEFTRTKTEMRGTIRDPYLEDFKDYGIPQEVYAIGHVLYFIFTGKESLPVGKSPIQSIVSKCVDPGSRYKSVLEIITDLDSLTSESSPATGA